LQVTFDNAKAQLASSDSRTVVFQSNLDGLNSELRATQSKVSSLQNQLAEQERRASETEASAIQLRGENVQLKTSLDELRSKVVSLTDEILVKEELANDLEVRERKLRTEVERLELQLSDSRGELEQVKGLLKDERNADRLEADSLRREIESWKHAWPYSPETLSHRMKEQEEELEKAERLIAARKEAEVELKADVTRLIGIMGNVSGLEERLHSLEVKLGHDPTVNGSAL